MSIDDTMATLRAEISSLGPPYPGRRFPTALRERLQGAVRTLSASLTDREVAKGLGLSTETVRRWRREGREAVAMVPVEVVSEPSTLRVVSPAGYVVEGLDLASAADLLRRVG